ncbi:MAG TPA: TIGR02206 family membrane protein [bacterium]|nr:TIGR02206 family membrane protein [bacterium]
MFKLFGPDHLCVLLVILAVSFALIFNAKRIHQLRDDRWIRYPLAFFLLLNGLSAQLYALQSGIYGLPLHLCDLALVAMIWTLLIPNRYVKEMAYFWGLAGSSQAILTPDLAAGFPSFPWSAFFFTHGGVVVSAVYLLARGNLNLTLASIWRAWGIGNIYLIFVALFNWHFGTNYMYLVRKPAHPSLLDYLGSWPYYILTGEITALIVFFLCYRLSKIMEQTR